MSDNKTIKVTANAPKKEGFFTKIFKKLDQSMKEKADEKAAEGCCCNNDDENSKGGKCC